MNEIEKATLKKIVKVGIAGLLILLLSVALVAFGFYKWWTMDFTIDGHPKDVLFSVKVSKQILNIASERGGFQADGYTYQAWQLADTEKHIAEICSPERIINKAVWKKAKDDKNYSDALASIQSHPKFFSIPNRLQRILYDPNSMICYEYLGGKKEDPSPNTGYYWGVRLWVCSPEKKVLIYLDFKD